MYVTPETLQASIKKDDRYFLPDKIRAAIERCLRTEDEQAITVEYNRIFQAYKELDNPTNVQYSGAITLDAYICYYFARNFFIPAIGLSDLAHGTFFHHVQESSSLRVLDVGSGTGAIVLGLIWLFSRPPLSSVSLDISVLDASSEALDRQKSILNSLTLATKYKWTAHIADTCDSLGCVQAVKDEGPFDLIFLANTLTEIPHQAALSLVGRLPAILSDRGAIIVAEPQRNFSKILVRKLLTHAPKLGLHIYYPCSGAGCPYSGQYCWVWRDHYYEVPNVKVAGSPLTMHTNSQLTACWLILTKQDISMYDPFKSSDQRLVWGPVSHLEASTALKVARSICHGNRQLTLNYDGMFSKYKRGHIIGSSQEGDVVKHHEI